MAATISGITTGLAKDTKGEVSIMVWSGDGEYYEDIGNPDSAAGKKLQILARLWLRT